MHESWKLFHNQKISALNQNYIISKDKDTYLKEIQKLINNNAEIISKSNVM